MAKIKIIPMWKVRLAREREREREARSEEHNSWEPFGKTKEENEKVIPSLDKASLRGKLKKNI